MIDTIIIIHRLYIVSVF